jgi:uncharacterized protein (TIGR02996 family)
VSDHDAILRAVIEEPEEDLPRLLYADWLEEFGSEEDHIRSEFIRVQCEIARLKSERCFCGDSGDPTGCFRCKTLAKLRRRELAFYMNPGTDSFLPDGMRDSHLTLRHIYFKRGFADSVSLDTEAWLEHGPTLCAAHPITRVMLMDKWPADIVKTTYWEWFDEGGPVPPDDAVRDIVKTTYWQWFDGGHDELAMGHDSMPRPIWRAYKGLLRAAGHNGQHPSQEDAIEWLSKACVAWARREAGLGNIRENAGRGG